MDRFTCALYFAFIAGILSTGCSAPTYLMNAPEPSRDEKMRQALESLGSWNGKPISTVIEKWGVAHGVINDETGQQIHVWSLPVSGFLGEQEVTDKYVPIDYTYQLTFYTHPDGVIYKTLVKPDQDSAGSSRWK